MGDGLKKLNIAEPSNVDISSELNRVIGMLYHGITKVNLKQHSAVVLKSLRQSEVGNQYD